MLFRLRAQGNVAERAEADEYVVAGAEVEHRGKCAGEDDLACTQGRSERIHLVCEPNHRVDRVAGHNGGAQPVYMSSPLRNEAIGIMDRSRSLMGTRRLPPVTTRA